MNERTCRVCGCTDYDCRQCIERTGAPCFWVEDDLCSACDDDEARAMIAGLAIVAFIGGLIVLLLIQ